MRTKRSRTRKKPNKKKTGSRSSHSRIHLPKDLADDQNNRIKQLFELIDKTNDAINKSYDEKIDKAKEDENIPKPTTEERIAALKKNFENVNAENVVFYQKLQQFLFDDI